MYIVTSFSDSDVYHLAIPNGDRAQSYATPCGLYRYAVVGGARCMAVEHHPENMRMCKICEGFLVTHGKVRYANNLRRVEGK